MKTTKWLGHYFESNGGYRTEDCNQFLRDVRSDVKAMVKGTDWVLHSFSAGYFYFAGFLYNAKRDRFVYFMSSDIRFFPEEWNTNLLIRTAKHDKDYTGGRNTYCLFPYLVNAADNLALDSFEQV
jgi:hypothetical protein